MSEEMMKAKTSIKALVGSALAGILLAVFLVGIPIFVWDQREQKKKTEEKYLKLEESMEEMRVRVLKMKKLQEAIVTYINSQAQKAQRPRPVKKTVAKKTEAKTK